MIDSSENCGPGVSSGVTEGRGSWVRVALNDVRAVFHEPHSEKEIGKGMVRRPRAPGRGGAHALEAIPLPPVSRREGRQEFAGDDGHEGRGIEPSAIPSAPAVGMREGRFPEESSGMAGSSLATGQ
jgi:hypothetical protein